MLVLSRQSGQGCVITDVEGNVLLEVTVEIVNGHKVRLGFKGERTIVVDRDEVWRAKMLSKPAERVD